MSTQRENLLMQQQSAENTIHTGIQSLPNFIKIHRVEKNKYGDEKETNDYVSYSPDSDTFKIYCRSRSIEFKGKDFDWIFKALASIGTEIPLQTVNFYDGNLVTPVKVFCGDHVKNQDLPEVENPETFEGWFYDEEFTQPFNLLNQVKEDISVYAKRAIDNEQGE